LDWVGEMVVDAVQDDWEPAIAFDRVVDGSVALAN
jgi:hypothetical protein